MADFDQSQPRLRMKVKNEGAITVYYPGDVSTSEDEGSRKERVGGLLLTRCSVFHHCSPKADEAITMRVIILRSNEEMVIKIFCPNCGLRLPDGNNVKLRTVKDLFTWCEWSEELKNNYPQLTPSTLV